MPAAPLGITAETELSFKPPQFPSCQIDTFAALPALALTEPEFGDEPAEFLEL